MSVKPSQIPGVTKHKRDFKGFPSPVLVFEIDGSAEYKGQPIRSLGRIGRRKFENLVFIENAKERLPMKFIYH